MITITDRSKCSGCYACVQACPTQCISMCVDEEGFWYPRVNEEKCVACDLCNETCPILHPISNTNTKEDVIVYAAVNCDDSIRLKSSSGGVFSVIASHVISCGGVVFGASFDEDLQVEHSFAETMIGIEKFRGSKYVQSKIGDMYRKAEIFLDEGRLVLFSGTPCQIAGLLSYLKQEYDNLIVQDIICHGVPSPMVWEKYMRYREAMSNSKLCNVNFRCKEGGKRSVKFIYMDNTEYVVSTSKDYYMRSFLKNLSLRPSCYACAFKDKYRSSDFTLADFWGVGRISPDMDDGAGVSLFMINSKKGREFFGEISQSIKYELVDLDIAIKSNLCMIKSVKLPAKRKDFLRSVTVNSFDELERRFLRQSLIHKIFTKCQNLIRR